MRNVRRFISLLFALCSFLLVLGCTLDGDEPTDYTIYFLGNSITTHEPNAGIGWYGNWGMAASSEENDYVHVLIRILRNEYEHYRINYGQKFVRSWEHDFSFETGDAEYNKIDLLIIRLGENVRESYAMDNDYYAALNLLIQKYKDSNTKVIVTDNYWPSEYKDAIQEKVALDNQYYFVQINDLFSVSENSAFGLFENTSVARHPSDKGMENIALRLFECIKEAGIME